MKNLKLSFWDLEKRTRKLFDEYRRTIPDCHCTCGWPSDPAARHPNHAPDCNLETYWDRAVQVTEDAMMDEVEA